MSDSKNLSEEIKEKSSLGDETIIPLSVKVERSRSFPLAPIGLYGFSISCLLPGLSNVGLIKYSSVSIGAFTLFGGLCQYFYFLFGWYENNITDIFLSGTYGIFNALFFYMNKYIKEGYVSPNGTSFGILNLCYCYVALISFIIGLKGNKINLINQMSVFFAFFFGAIGNFKNNDVCLKISGGFNIFVGINTFYMGTALLLIGVYGRTILPLFAPGEKIQCSE